MKCDSGCSGNGVGFPGPSWSRGGLAVWGGGEEAAVADVDVSQGQLAGTTNFISRNKLTPAATLQWGAVRTPPVR